MKTRHAAALALVGWYLMVPRSSGSEAVLYSWSILHSYDTAQACEAAREKSREEAEASLPPGALKSRLTDLSICVASDDPRLKVPFELKIPPTVLGIVLRKNPAPRWDSAKRGDHLGCEELEMRLSPARW